MNAPNNQYQEALKTAKNYYNSQDAHTFYSTIWRGEDLHIGTFRRPEDTIYDASRRSVDGIASLSQNINEHYSSVLQETIAREEELLKNNVSESYLTHMKTGLQNWINGAKYGHLDWGWFCFKRP